MKKLLIITVSLFMAISAFAQPAVKGVKIEGNYLTFVKGLQEAGCTYKGDATNAVVMKGSFAGLGDCTFFISYTKTTKEVYQVMVLSPKHTSWDGLMLDYNNLIASYTRKYGPVEKYRRHFSPPFESGDGYELTALKSDKCDYTDLWSIPNGQILICLNTDTSILIGYTNTVTEVIANAEKKGSINSDI